MKTPQSTRIPPHRLKCHKISNHDCPRMHVLIICDDKDDIVYQESHKIVKWKSQDCQMEVTRLSNDLNKLSFYQVSHY